MDDGRFVGGMDGNVTNASCGREDEREERGTEETEERGKTVGANDFDLIFLCACGLCVSTACVRTWVGGCVSVDSGSIVIGKEREGKKDVPSEARLRKARAA